MPFGFRRNNVEVPEDEFRKGYRGDSALDDAWTAEARGGAAGGARYQTGDMTYDPDSGRWESAADRARKTEAGAVKEKSSRASKAKGGIDDAKAAEKNAGDGAEFKNSVTGKDGKGEKGKKGKGAPKPAQLAVSGKLKKMGPFGIILLIVGVTMGIFSASTALAPFGLINNLMDNFNAFRTSMNTRSYNVMPRLIKSGKNTSLVKTSIFGYDKFKINSKMQTKLMKNGVYYDVDRRIMVFTDMNSGKSYGVAADTNTLGNIPSEIDVPDADGNLHHVTIDSDARMTYYDALEFDEGFFTANEKATRTLKGHIAGWFDSIAEKFHIRIGNSRNRQKLTTKGADDPEIEANAKKEGIDEETKAASDLDIEGDDTENPPKNPARDNQGDGVNSSGNDAVLKPGMSEGDVQKSLSARAKTAAAQLGKAASIFNVASIGCAALKVINSVTQTVVALQKAQIINFGTGMSESIQKTQTGDSSTEWNFYGNKMMAPDENGKTAFGSAPISQAFADGTVIVSDQDPLAKQISLAEMTENVYSSKIFGGKVLDGISALGGNLMTYKTCVDLQMISQGLNAAAGIADVVATILSGGLWAIFSWLGRQFMQAIVMTAIMGGIAAFISSVMVPWVAKMLAQDLIGEDTIGPILAYATDSSANSYQGGHMQAATGLPGTEPRVLAQYEETQRVIASEARYIRNTHSPFDVSTKYTFLGSIVNSMTPIALSLSSPLSVISNTANLVGSAVRSVLPSANALGNLGIKTSLSHRCGPLSNVLDDRGDDAVCDAYGNPYFVTNLDTINNDPADVMDTAARHTHKELTTLCIKVNGIESCSLHAAEIPNFTKGYYGDFDNFPNLEEMMHRYYYSKTYRLFYDGGDNILRKDPNDDGESAAGINPEIREHSEMANYIVSCVVRESQYGQEDSRVSQYVLNKTGTTMETMTDSLIGAIPIVGDIISAGQSAIERENAEWITGENCVKDRYRGYSRYSEDQRWLESSEIVGESAVSVFLDKYYEENPLDFSYEGVLARYSGQTKEEVELALGVIEYTTYIANYEPKELGPVRYEPVEYHYTYDSATVIAQIFPDALRMQYIIYDDLRGRVWTV